jgi:hypothetical protein
MVPTEIDGASELLNFPEIGGVALGDLRVRQAIHTAYGGTDFWCRNPIPIEGMYLDHVVPRSVGGADNVFNVVPTNRTINAQKGEKYDPVAILPVLSIIRLHYGWRVVSALGIQVRRTEWWKVDPARIAAEPLHPGDIPWYMRVDAYIERRRVALANRFALSKGQPFDALANELISLGIFDYAVRGSPARWEEVDYQTHSGTTAQAWRRVIKRERCPT